MCGIKQEKLIENSVRYAFHLRIEKANTSYSFTNILTRLGNLSIPVGRIIKTV